MRIVFNGAVCTFFWATLVATTSVFAHENHEDGNHSHAKKPNVLTTRGDAKVIAPSVEEDGFQFIIYGDRTGGVPAGLKVLEQAVSDTNLLDPDLVMTVGDLIQGYNETPDWLKEADEYKAIMSRLKMRWFPVAGNHDIYWRGKNPAPAGHHETNYEKHFGPLWYSFRHKNAGFIVLYSDEGDPDTNRKAFNDGKLQQMSPAQLSFLDASLKDLSDQDHIFVFLHHPRWIGGGYTGSNWEDVHQKLKNAGNVSAVFAGHIHRMRYDGQRDGIEYYALATTGGHIPDDTAVPGAGTLHHFNIVTVRPKRITVSSLPVGAVFDPKQFTPAFLNDIAKAKNAAPKQLSKPVRLSVDGACADTTRISIKNPAERPIEMTLYLSVESLENEWTSTLDHEHITLDPGEQKTLEFLIRRNADDGMVALVPSVAMTTRYLGESAAVDIPERLFPLSIALDQVPADYFSKNSNRALKVTDDRSAIRIENDQFQLPQGPFTLEAWVKLANHSGYDGILAKTEGSEYAFFSDYGSAKFDVHLGGKYVTASSNQKLPVNQWTHLAGVYDGKNVVLYVNGQKADSTPANGKRKTNKLPLFLGADTDGSGSPTRAFEGQLDEVRLSIGARYTEDFRPDRRLSPDQQTILMHHLDRAAGPFVLDHSESAANGVLGPTSRLVPVK